MTDDERIAELERRVEDLENKIAVTPVRIAGGSDCDAETQT